jgi:hypothetical protein
MTEYEMKDGTLCVSVVNDDGSCFSMPKADYEAITLPSELSIPSTPQAGA